MLKYQTLRKKYFTTSDYNKFIKEIVDAKIKEKGLFNKFNIYNLNYSMEIKRII